MSFPGLAGRDGAGRMTAAAARRDGARRGNAMVHVTYRIVEHDGGWAYRLGDVFSGTFPTREAALAAARRVAREQRTPGNTESIEYEDADGVWHQETAPGNDRPDAEVEG